VTGMAQGGRTVRLVDPRPRRARAATWACLLLLASACAWGNYLGEARATFAKDFSCPPGGVTVAIHKGPPWPFPTPPSEVATDPARLAYWRRQQEEKRAEQGAKLYYVADGCGHHVTYSCDGWGDGPSCGPVEPWDPLSPPPWSASPAPPDGGCR
jgi:hypothetical protein